MSARPEPPAVDELLAPERAAAAPSGPLIHPGLALRLLAALIDLTALLILWLLWAIVAVLGLGAGQAEPGSGDLAFAGGTLAIYWLYYAASEGGPRQASWGKWALGLRLARADGGSVGLGRASLRALARLLTAATVGAGFVTVLTTAHRQALHDLLSGCMVLRRPPAPAAPI